jgi:hypothetical protein
MTSHFTGKMQKKINSELEIQKKQHSFIAGYLDNKPDQDLVEKAALNFLSMIHHNHS